MTYPMSRSDVPDLPPGAAALGWGGVLPFAGLAAGAWSPEWQGFAVQGFVAYAALILSFLGGVRWGRAMAAGAGTFQFGLAVLPSLWGWLAWLALPPMAALAVLGAGFALVGWWDGRFDALAAPSAFRRLRRGLSAVVVGCHGIAMAGLGVAGA